MPGARCLVGTVISLAPPDGVGYFRCIAPTSQRDISEVKADELSLCQSEPKQNRPTEMGAKEGSGQLMMTTKGVKK
jgi:hypothetical protein